MMVTLRGRGNSVVIVALVLACTHCLLVLHGDSSCFVAAQAAPKNRLAGVPNSKRELYLDTALKGKAATFVCFDGSVTLPGTAVNDDYCDCPDGSDEPGTAACPNMQFYCLNKGHVGKYIPSSLVNDGICDCCDGSDEVANPSLAVQCVDTCLEAGAAHRAAQAENIRIAEEGARLKAELVQQGNTGVDAIRSQLDAKREALSTIADRLEQAEQTAALENALEQQERDRREGNRDNAVMEAMGLGPGQPGGTADNLRSVMLSFIRKMNATDTFVEMLNEKARDAYQLELQTFNDRVQSAGQTPNEEPLVPPVPPVEVEWPTVLEAGGYVRPQAEAARAALEEVESEEASLQSEISTLEKNLDTDYGPNNEWWSWKDRCIETTASKYTYKICPFKEAKQDHTRLGTWSGFKDKTFTSMVFNNGATCWNGPKRSITVSLQCGLSDELSQVEEPSTCTYTAVLVTPAACDLNRGKELQMELDATAAQEATRSEL